MSIYAIYSSICCIDDDYIRLIEYDRRSPERRLPCFRVMFDFWEALVESLITRGSR